MGEVLQQLAAVGRLLADDHPEERRLPRAVRADDADDAPLGQVEGEVVDEGKGGKKGKK